jgi:hypothetical protein
LEEERKYIRSIRRYIKYIFGFNSFHLNKNKAIRENQIAIVDENEDLDKKAIDFYLKYFRGKLIVTGIYGKSNHIYVNLLDIKNFGINIEKALSRDYSSISPFLYINEVKSKIGLLFKGHGEESLFDVLNKTRQCLSNGPKLLVKNILDWDEYKKQMLIPGIKKWDVVKIRFGKYEIYLKISGFTEEIRRIKENIKDFNVYVEKIQALNKDQFKKIRLEEINKANDYLATIDSILMEIKRKIDLKNE